MGWQKVNQGSWGGGNGSADVNALAGGGGWPTVGRAGTVGGQWAKGGWNLVLFLTTASASTDASELNNELKT